MDNPDILTAFSQVFTPAKKFPRWWQPNPNIGQILVHSQEEEDEYAARDWTPKPLPGSELPPVPLDTQAQIDKAKAELAEQMAKFAEQQAEFYRMVEGRLGGQTGTADGSSGGTGAAASASGAGAATLVAGALSDASTELPADPPAVVVPGKKK